jgi:hypothetical protein
MQARSKVLLVEIAAHLHSRYLPVCRRKGSQQDIETSMGNVRSEHTVIR